MSSLSLNSNSDLECAPVKEDVHIETSFASHLLVYPTIHSASTCSWDTPCSLTSSSDELSPPLTQGSEVVHDENSFNAQDSSHSSSSCMLHEDNSSMHHAKAEKFDEACDRYGCHPKSNFEISNNIHRQVMYDLVHISKCQFSILEISGMFHWVKELQHPLMVMSIPCNSGMPLKLNQI